MSYENYCKIRDSKGMKDADVVKATGIPKSTFSEWKKGTYQPKEAKRRKIAELFGVTLEYLDTGEVDEEDGYYLNPETAAEAQEMFEDPDMRALFDMKRNMDPKKFKAHMDMMKQLYNLERGMDDTGC